MATGKKFYWIKLRKDFMTGDVVDFLMSQRNGSQYVVLYQMLCMMCINTKGALSRQIGELIIPFDIDKIQRDCKYFSRDTIAVALGLFKKVGLIYEQDAGVLAITGFENLVGCETDYAIQKRNQRQLPDSITDNAMDSSEDGNMDNTTDATVDTGADSDMDNATDNSMDKDADRSVDNDVDNSMDRNADSSVDNVHTEKEIELEKEIRVKNLEKETEKNMGTVSDETVCQTDVRRIVDAWNDLQDYGIKPISRLGSGSKRYRSLAARIREYDAAGVLRAIERIKASDFLRGRNKNGWVITFDWFVLPNNFPKVFEGNYDRQTGNGCRTEFNEWEDA